MHAHTLRVLHSTKTQSSWMSRNSEFRVLFSSLVLACRPWVNSQVNSKATQAYTHPNGRYHEPQLQRQAGRHNSSILALHMSRRLIFDMSLNLTPP
jgi:hypothetical protein